MSDRIDDWPLKEVPSAFADRIEDQLLNARDFLSRLQHAIRPGMSMDDCLTLLVEATAVLQATERIVGVTGVAKPPSPPDHREADNIGDGLCHPCAHRRHAAANEKAAAARREVLRLARENITLQRQVAEVSPDGVPK